VTAESDRQYWNTSYARQEDDELMSSWRNYLIERGYTPQGLRHRIPNDKLKELIMGFLDMESRK
jgi:hypothetical protein